MAANRRNAVHSTGPRSTAGKRRSRSNALQHGLAANTVVPTLEDADDYRAFEAAIAADYQPQTAVERHLVARLTSLLWRLRRALLIETGLFEIHGRILQQRRRQAAADARRTDLSVFYRYQRPLSENSVATPLVDNEATHSEQSDIGAECLPRPRSDAASAFLRLCHLNNGVIDRLGRYETALWRQVAQILLLLDVAANRRAQTLQPGAQIKPE